MLPKTFLAKFWLSFFLSKKMKFSKSHQIWSTKYKPYVNTLSVSFFVCCLCCQQISKRTHLSNPWIKEVEKKIRNSLDTKKKHRPENLAWSKKKELKAHNSVLTLLQTLFSFPVKLLIFSYTQFLMGVSKKWVLISSPKTQYRRYWGGSKIISVRKLLKP